MRSRSNKRGTVQPANGISFRVNARHNEPYLTLFAFHILESLVAAALVSIWKHMNKVE